MGYPLCHRFQIWSIRVVAEGAATIDALLHRWHKAQGNIFAELVHHKLYVMNTGAIWAIACAILWMAGMIYLDWKKGKK